jgi:hypothetical protein
LASTCGINISSYLLLLVRDQICQIMVQITCKLI